MISKDRAWLYVSDLNHALVFLQRAGSPGTVIQSLQEIQTFFKEVVMARSPLIFEHSTMDFVLQQTARQYSKAPAWFLDWLDDLSIRLSEDWRKITLDEVCTLQSLSIDDDWMPEPFAVNTVYKLFDRLGRDTSGIIGY